MQAAQDRQIEELKARLRKQRRRHERGVRTARAEGFLDGVCAMLRPGDIAIDCGANVGDISARLLDTGAEVIAFDPEPWAIEQLRGRFSDRDRLTLHNAAVGCRDGTITLLRAEDFESDAASASVKSTILTGGRAIDADNGIPVKLIDFVAFLRDLTERRGEVAFLKMDIEGAELDLLDALDEADLISRVRCMAVETHEKKFRDLAPRYADLRRRFAEKYAPTHVNLDWI